MRTHIPGKTITEQLRHVLDALSGTSQSTADAIGISASSLSRFRAGKGGLRLSAIERLCEHLGLRLIAV